MADMFPPNSDQIVMPILTFNYYIEEINQAVASNVTIGTHLDGYINLEPSTYPGNQNIWNNYVVTNSDDNDPNNQP